MIRITQAGGMPIPGGSTQWQFSQGGSFVIIATYRPATTTNVTGTLIDTASTNDPGTVTPGLVNGTATFTLPANMAGVSAGKTYIFQAAVTDGAATPSVLADNELVITTT
jgi:hypothetical protein